MSRFLKFIVTISSILSFLGFLNLKRDKIFGRFTVTRWVSIRHIFIFPVLFYLRTLIPMEILLKGLADYKNVNLFLTKFFRDIVEVVRVSKLVIIILYIFVQFRERNKIAKYIKILFRLCYQNKLLKLSPKSSISSKLFAAGIILSFISEFFIQQKFNLFGVISFFYLNFENFFILGYTFTVFGSLIVLESILNTLNHELKICLDAKKSRLVVLSKMKNILDFKRLMQSYLQSFGILLTAVTVFNVLDVIFKVRFYI